MHVSVIIPVYNALELAQKCVQSIFDAGSELAFEVIVVDNGSEPEFTDPRVRCLRYPRPLGYARAVNAGAASAAGRVLILLNSDTFVNPGWMEGLYQALESDPALGVVTPLTNLAGEPAQIGIRAPKPEISYLPQRVTFFCAALRREIWSELAGLDESYGVGNFEDDDLCLRLRVAGYRLAVARHLFIQHQGNATFHANQIDHSEWMTRNAAVFAARARALSEARTPTSLRRPKRSADTVSIVIQPRPGASLDRTLRSLANQTVQGFEIVHPGQQFSRSWIAYVTQGDILYPFHIETLHDVLECFSSDAVYSDGWIAAANEPFTGPHPGLDGWMHHASVDRDRLWEQSKPVRWPRLTWETEIPPTSVHLPPATPQFGAIEFLRGLYRRSLRIETRHAIDSRFRKVLGLVLNDPVEKGLKDLATQLSAITMKQPGGIPAVVTFNAVPWHSAVQRQHHFARGLAERGYTVIWVETDLRPPAGWRPGRLQQAAPNLYLIRLPGPTREIYHMPWSPGALDAMCAALILEASNCGLNDIVSLVNYPRWQPLAVRLREKAGWKVVYDCLDDQVALADIYKTPLGKEEQELVDVADLLLTSSAVLRERLCGHPVTLLHNGADYRLFSSASSKGHLRHLPRPVIGFFGALADWLDMGLIRAAALRFPEWSFVYIGPHAFSCSEMEARWTRSTNLPNITLLPQLDQLTLAVHTAEFDVCIMPFEDIPVTRTMNAVKLYEYLAAGKPTISRRLPEVCHLDAGDLIDLYSTPEEFFECLRCAVAADTPELKVRRQAFASQNDWSERLEVLVREIKSMSSVSRGSKTWSQE